MQAFKGLPLFACTMLSSIQSFLRRFTARSLLPKVVPIRTLKAKHRPLVLHHLLQLSDAG